jgi:TPR repeat
MWRRALFTALGFFVAIGAAYGAGRIVEVGLGNSWAGPVSAIAFATAMMVINRRMKMRAKNDLDRAIADYDEAIRLDPKYAVAFNDRGLDRGVAKATTIMPDRKACSSCADSSGRNARSQTRPWSNR